MGGGGHSRRHLSQRDLATTTSFCLLLIIVEFATKSGTVPDILLSVTDTACIAYTAHMIELTYIWIWSTGQRKNKHSQFDGNEIK